MTTEPSSAVFLSYTSQDAPAARRICEALRTAGIEVWFDQSELRGGDVWDQKIRHQIRDCAIFIPIVSGNTQARTEGYFRLEWRLADQRTHLMARSRAYLVPVCIDDTSEAEAEVPDSFSAVQWTRLPQGNTSAAFVDRVQRLLLPDEHLASSAGRQASSAEPVGSRVGASPVSQPAARNSGSPRRPRAALLLMVAAVIIAAGYVVFRNVELSRRAVQPARTPESASPALSPAPQTAPEKSIAVLPFVDLSEKKDQEYFSDGLSEELIDLLTKVPDLRVPARTSSFYFKGQHATIAEIAKALSVAQVLEGSVRKAGNTIRVTAQLVRADNGYHLWSETYDRDLKDVFKVQDEIAGAVVTALKLKLAPAQQSSSHRTANTEAYNQYLLGRQFLDRSGIDDTRRAIAAFRRAVELDPGYAAAYAGLATAEMSNDQAGDAGRWEISIAASNKAVMLAPEQADGYVARGNLRYSFNRDWSAAQKDFETALAIDPGNSSVHRQYAGLLLTLVRLPEAIAAARKATELDPLSSAAWGMMGHVLMANSQFVDAHEALRRSLEIQPEVTYPLNDLATIQLLEGRAADALATFRQLRNDFDLRLAGIAIAEYTLGHSRESQQALDELIAKGAQHGAFQIAEVYAWRGEKDQAFEWLQRAYQQHDGGLSDIKIDAMLNTVRGDVRYGALLRKLNLPQ